MTSVKIQDSGDRKQRPEPYGSLQGNPGFGIGSTQCPVKTAQHGIV
jgi:hypothetical protein